MTSASEPLFDGPSGAGSGITEPPDPSRYRQGLRCLHEYLRLHARAQPDKPAFIWYGREIGYLELDRWSDALAVRLAQLGVAPGDRVALPAHAPAIDDIALLTYTSGTTGLPKGAMLSHRNALFKTGVTADCNDVRGDDVTLAVAPVYHIAGMLMGIDATLYAGCTTVLLHRFDPLAVLQAIERYRVTWWYGMAPMNVAVMQVPDAGRFELRSLRLNPTTRRP
jgi:acyl-CoA synthetase (AMP-forming)/AMP-acid ligase II